jgi:membrane protease subunit (stomatin/prohibitin family)
MTAIGDLAAYQAYQVGAATPVAAANPAGGLAGAGVGVGMGMAIAGRFPASAPAGGSALPPPPPATWHVVENGQAVGPWTAAQLAQGVAAGRIGPDTLVWCAGMAEWAAARTVPALAALFQSPPPPPRS